MCGVGRGESPGVYRAPQVEREHPVRQPWGTHVRCSADSAVADLLCASGMGDCEGMRGSSSKDTDKSGSTTVCAEVHITVHSLHCVAHAYCGQKSGGTSHKKTAPPSAPPPSGGEMSAEHVRKVVSPLRFWSVR